MTYINNYPLLNLNISGIAFREAPAVRTHISAGIGSDSYITNPQIERFGSVEQIEQAARNNPEIIRILKENGIPLKVNAQALQDLRKGHLQSSRIAAAQIYSSLPQEIKSEINMSDLQQAAMFHDIGKVLIPASILDKKGALTDDERKIMETHSELGYELLKNSGLSESVLNLIKYHHQNAQGSGYPQVGSDFEYVPALDVLRAADEYTALREERSYKPPMSKEDALSIVSQDVEKGNISPEVYNALVKSTV